MIEMMAEEEGFLCVFAEGVEGEEKEKGLRGE